MNEDRFSTAVRGDLEFAGSREVATEFTPADEVVAIEGSDLEDEVLRSQLILYEAEDLGDAALVAKAEARLAAAVGALEEWKEAGRGDARPLPYTPLRDAIGKANGRAGEPDMSEEDRARRLESWRVMLAYVFQDGYANPWQGFKNFLGVVRRVAPEFLDGLTANDLAMILGEGKAAESAREIRIFEDKLRQWGVVGYHAFGGTKSDEARENCREAARGNTNRRRGARAKKRAAREAARSSAAAAFRSGEEED